MSKLSSSTTRRGFLTSSAVAGAALASQVGAARAANDVPILKIGLIGCGGRGTGAAIEALRTDRHVELTAMADIFKDKLDRSLGRLHKELPDRIKVPAKRCFLGFDAYQQAIDSGVDVVLLAAPPAFRPQHLAAAVAAGKHSFCECTAGIDAPGVRSFLKSAETARQKKLGILSGFCWRYSYPHRAVREQIQKGTIGDVRAIYATYLRSSFSGRYGGKRQPGWSDLEWQLRDWADFLWLGGDLSILLSGGHSVDKMSWWLGDAMPIKAVATGGKQSAGEGNIFDHAHIVYEYASGVRGFLAVRAQDSCHDENNDYIIGSRGICTIGRGPAPVITGDKPWRYTGPANNMYQTEQNEFFASLRKGEPINDGQRMAHTTLMAIMGRMAAYTGQEVTWERALNSKERLVPEKFDWKMKVPETPVAVPGRTKFF
jgi:predicted dehydrogenase